jgi:hypothetical protein
VSALVAAIGYLSWIRHPHMKRYGVGPIQVLGGPDEIWVFMERNILAARTGWSDYYLRIACDQEVIIFRASGEKKRISIPDGKEVTFHENMSRVFRHNNDLYLLRGASGGWHGSLFKWENDHFELMPLESYYDFVKANGLDENIAQFDPGLDRLTEQGGWTHLCGDVDWIMAPFTFTWNGQEFEIEDERQPGDTKVHIRSLGLERQWEEVLLQFDPTPIEITRDEYERLWNSEEPGHRN